MTAMSVSQIEDEARALVRRAASVHPAKVMARRTGLTERHVRGLSKGEHMPGGAALLALAHESVELRTWIGRKLGLLPGPEAAALLREAARFLETQAEEGDRQTGD